MEPERRSAMVEARLKVDKSLDAQIRRMKEVLRLLKREYPEAECSLSYETPFQLIIATVLSAQCTDERVNKVTPALFKKFPTAQKMSKATIPELEELVKTTGFFRSKAKALKETSIALVEQYQGEVPQTLDELVKLRGVGRKTANVVLGNAFGIPGLVVDTHVGRISRRMDFVRFNDPVKVEQAMMKIVPREDWTDYAHLLIAHGRAICTARRALCSGCPVARFCPKIGVA
jgi:endonuclease-3